MLEGFCPLGLGGYSGALFGGRRNLAAADFMPMMTYQAR